MKNINSVVIVGRLTKDAEVKTVSENPVAYFAICANSTTKKDGNWTDKPNFFRCRLYGKRADSLSSYLTKGKLVGVQGSLRQDTWGEGTDRKETIYISVDEVELFGGNQSRETSVTKPAQAPEDFDDDIPF
jgi:single-strand DNA-binding protein